MDIRQELKKTILLGIRSIVIENLPQKHKDEFERIVLKGSDDDLFLFGCKFIPQFSHKLTVLLSEIKKAYKKDLYEHS